MKRYAALFWGLLLMTTLAGAAETVTLSAFGLKVELEPRTLALKGNTENGELLPLSRGVFNRNYEVRELTEQRIILSYGDMEAELDITPRGIRVQLTVREPEELTWPRQPLPEEGFLIWPKAEGRYIPLDSELWREYLEGEARDLGSGLPLWGVVQNNTTLSWAAATPFRSELLLKNGELMVRNRFLCRRGPEQRLFLIDFAPGEAPLAPAKLYRSWLEGDRSVAFPGREARRSARWKQTARGSPRLPLGSGTSGCSGRQGKQVAPPGP